MAAASVVPDSEREDTPSQVSKKKGKGKNEPEPTEVDEEGEDDEEYEIEAILKHAKGKFESVRDKISSSCNAPLNTRENRGKWPILSSGKCMMILKTILGCASRMPSTFLRANWFVCYLLILIRNAQELIDEYWNKKASKKENGSVARKGRKSAALESPEPSISTKKRGRKPLSADEKPSAAKRQKNTSDQEDVDMDDEPSKIVDAKFMHKYNNLESWEDIVQSIDTVERSPLDGSDLTVYIRL